MSPFVSRKSLTSARKNASSFAPMWEQFMYRRGFIRSLPGSVVSSAPNQNPLLCQGIIPLLPLRPPTPRRHCPPPLLPLCLRLRLHPHLCQREGCHRSIHWLCLTKRVPSAPSLLTGRPSLKVLPTSPAGQSSAMVSTYSTSSWPRLISLVVNNQLRGTGTGRNQKVAKEEAARQAFQAMGWGSK